MKKSQHHVVDEQEIMRFNLRRESERGKVYNPEQFKELLRKIR